MGRELQKKKNRSSIPKKRQNPKSKKKILHNPIIAANWYCSPHTNPPKYTILTAKGHKEQPFAKTTNVSVSPQNSIPPPAAKKNQQST
jgi:hypothetical protein